MDRISAIRNIEDALRQFEEGEASLAETERQTVAVLRTYATEFDGPEAVYQAHGPDPIDGTVVVAPSAAAARKRIQAHAEATSSSKPAPQEVAADDLDRTAGSDTIDFEIEEL